MITDLNCKVKSLLYSMTNQEFEEWVQAVLDWNTMFVG